jgi:two-component system CheB/CheR fusion protein
LPLAQDNESAKDAIQQLLQNTFAQLRARTGRDFSRYKQSTIMRRIQRRMQLRRIEEFAQYVELLAGEPNESKMLADDLLVTVTNFFRDPDVFHVLEETVIPQLLDSHSSDEPLRLWSVGCATGEEAYSLAILLLEELTRRKCSIPIQIFASDLHERSLQRAREGFYPGDIETDVSQERLRAFFEKEDGGFRVRKEVRELVVFAPHNLMGDPPFSRIDLISCRNLMIYLQRDVQNEVIELFHYALKPDGFLVLGTSETLESLDLFRIQDKKCCIFRKRNTPTPEPRLPVFPIMRARIIGERVDVAPPTEPISYGALHQHLVEQFVPPSLLVSPDNRIVHLSQQAGRYLLQPGGEFTSSIFKLVRDELRMTLRSALRHVRDQEQAMITPLVLVRLEDTLMRVRMHVKPALGAHQAGFVLVVFHEESPISAAELSHRDAGDATQSPAADPFAEKVKTLESELLQCQQRIQSIIEEYETGQEELKASNEELQSANEELRSTLEELETSKEELQSMNEELQTVNQENRHKVSELAQLSGDLQNLMAATDIATLFLDCNLRILRFTPQIGKLFNIRTTDRGRPLSDLTHRLGYDGIQHDARQVLETLSPTVHELQDEEGRWYLTRLLPYRSSIDRIEGVVITFVDITQRVNAEIALRQSEETLREADRRKNEFLATLAHELRNPLAPIRSGLELMKTMASDPDQLESIRTTMERQTKQLISLVDDLLDISRITRGTFRLRKHPVPMADIVANALESAKPLMENTGHQLQIDLQTTPIYVDADPNRLTQVVTNLLNNAIRYTPRGGEITLKLAEQAATAKLSITDSGVGIPAGKLNHIFEMFSQIEHHDQPGTGLGVGLTLAKQLVEMHGGQIHAKSDGAGMGSEFIVELPRILSDKVEIPAEPASAPPSSPTRLRILIVDDNQDAAKILSSLISAIGHETCIANDGLQAIGAAARFEPQVVLMDLGMPKMDGFEAAKRMRQEPFGSRIVLVAITGWGQEEDRQRTRAAGFDHHLTKPVGIDALTEIFARVNARQANTS